MSANKPLSGNGENVHSMGVNCIKKLLLFSFNHRFVIPKAPMGIRVDAYAHQG